MMAAFAVLLHNDNAYSAILDTGQKLSFGTHKKDDVQVPGFGPAQVTLQSKTSGIFLDAGKAYQIRLNPAPMDSIILLNQDTRTALFLSSHTSQAQQTLRLPYNCSLAFGRKSENDVCISLPFVSGKHFTLKCDGGHVRVEDLNSTNGLFLNGKRIKVAAMRSGDVLSILSVQVKLLNGELLFYNVGDTLTIRQPQEDALRDDRTHVSGQASHYLKYSRSPRIQSQLPAEDITLAPPPAKGQKLEKGRGMFSSLLGSGVMLATTALTGAVSPALMAARAASMIAPAASYAGSKKEGKRRMLGAERYEAARKERYGAYIADQKARIEAVAKVQRDILAAENPAPGECVEILNGLQRSLWERMPSDRDFLDVRLGMGYEELCISVKARADNAVQMEDDEVQELSRQIIEETRIVDNIPARLRLLEYTTVGMIGPRDKVIQETKNLLIALCTAHCAEDVRIVGIFDRQEQHIWEPLRWLPHVRENGESPRLLAFGLDDAHAMCELLGSLLRERREGMGPGAFDAQSIPSPYYILIFGSKRLVEREPMLGELFTGGPAMGITSLFLFDDIYALPHDCRYIVDMDNGPSCFLRSEANRRTFFTPDAYIGDSAFDLFARRQAAIKMEGFARIAGLPEGISFLRGFGVDAVEQLDVLGRWRDSRPESGLGAPIGVLDGNKTFELDISETGHGPHGLVAGTTGSGKSELLQTWILSMALNYHPHDVEFVLIDYKGGGMANLLEPLPHVVGKITNIGTNIERLLLSLQYEKDKRQAIFDQYGVNHIDKYLRLYRAGRAQAPLPHLVIVADEFAELKKEEPAFMSQLVSIARVGRSLGIHMVLATQKPAGVVDDQIQSNTRFRLCLKVQDAADSRDMIRRPDAAKIAQPGRAYVRVGEDEVFELFQSYWSGAPYSGPGGGTELMGNQVRIVDGRGRRIRPVQSARRGPRSELDELTAVVQYIERSAAEIGLEKLQGPWLPELPGEIPLQGLLEGGFAGGRWDVRQPWLTAPIGMYDSPATQSQGVQCMDLAGLGHFGIYGAPGTGKTTLLKTIVLSLGMCYTPEDVNIYIMDFGGWSMKLFESMPHVGGVALDQEEEKLLKLAKLLTEEFENRKRIFLQNAVSSLSAYREAVSAKLPAIVLVIDNFTPMLDICPDLEGFITTLAREGAAYGIYMICTANSASGIRYRVQQNIRGAVAFELTDRGDYAALVGRLEGSMLPPIVGRAYYKSAPPIEFQAALPLSGANEQERTLALGRLLEEMDAAWRGPRPRPIPVMPETVPQEALLAGYDRREVLPIGILYEDITMAYMDLSEHYNMLISGPERCGKSAMLARLGGLIAARFPESRIYAMDSGSGSLAGIEGIAYQYAKCTDGPATDGMLAGLIDEMNQRKRAQNQARQSEGTGFDEAAFTAGLPMFCIIIDDLREFVEAVAENTCNSMERICRLAQGLGVIVLAAGRQADLARLSGIETLTMQIAGDQRGLAIHTSPGQTPFFRCSLGYGERDAAAGEGNGYLFVDGDCRKVKLV